MADLFSGLPDLLLEEIAGHLVPPGTTAWALLQKEVFPLRLLTPRFTYYLTSTLLKSVTLRLHPLELEDSQAFVHFRRRVRPSFLTKRLTVSRHTLPSGWGSHCECRPNRQVTCAAHRREKANASAVTRYLGQAINVCRSGLEDLSITIFNLNPDEDVYHDSESRNTFFPFPRLRKIMFKGDKLKPILQTVCAAASKLAVIDLQAAVSANADPAKERGSRRPIPAIRQSFGTLISDNIAWLALEIRATRMSLRPIRLECKIIVHDLQPLVNILDAIASLERTPFFEKLEAITITLVIGLDQTGREQVAEAFRLAAKGRDFAVDWPGKQE